MLLAPVTRHDYIMLVRVAFTILADRLGKVALGSVLFVGLTLFFKGLILDVEYQKVPVVKVVQVPGKSMNNRLVVVDLGDGHWPIRVSDRLLVVTEGDIACVAKRKVLSPRWVHYSLTFPGFCRNKLTEQINQLQDRGQLHTQNNSGDAQECSANDSPLPPLRQAAITD